MDAIQIQPGTGQSISATTSSSGVEVGADAPRGWIAISDGGLAFVGDGITGEAATTSDLPCLDGAYVPILIRKGATHIFAITASGTSIVRLYPLQGMRT